jgi:hypothetical protein
MALPILDGNQSATTLSSILTSGEHIPAHTVVSLGTQAITDISGAVSGSVVSISNFPATQTIAGIVGPIGGSVFKGGSASTDAIRALPYFSQNGFANYNELSTNNPLPIAGTITIGSLPAISGTVTANASFASTTATYPSQIVAIGYKDEINTGNITPVTNDGDGGLPVFLGGISVEGNNNAILPTWLDGQEALNVPIAGTVTIGNSVTIASLPAISGTVTANLSISSTVITSGSFSSLSSATLVPENPARKMATVFNLGAGQLFINAGATATTLGGGFMVALSSGDFYECDYTTTTLSAIFATAGTASWMSH